MWILCKAIVSIHIIASILAINVQGQPSYYGKSEDDLVKFYVYTRQNEDLPQQLSVDVESIVRSGFNPIKPTTVAIHGIQGDKSAEECLIIKDTKLKIQDANIIIVDYSYLVHDKDLESASGSALLVANVITDLIIMLRDAFHMELQDVHIVGFSLGGQIAGLVGQNVYNNYGQKVERITALDPAGILFTDSTPINERLTSDDADYVEVIHTNIEEFGFRTPCGHVDYYPNGGKIQPGCEPTENTCSHKRAYQLIPDMWSPIENQELLLLKCANIEFMSLDSCRWINQKMGDLDQQPEGIYYVETNPKKPFGKGAFKSNFF